MTNNLVSDNLGIISEYIINEQARTLTIKYLDKNEKIIYGYTDNDIKQIEKQMLEQASSIVHSFYRRKKNIKRKNDGITMAMFIVAFSFAELYCNINRDNINSIHEIIATILAVLPGSFSMLYLSEIEQKNELEAEKYKIYLDNIERFNSNLFNKDLYKGIDEKGLIGINTIDKYTYDEMQRLRYNLSLIRHGK